ncbi:Type I Iterative PKS [Podospora bellae-mahoneyi]|uniref:Type I Iterative PKS n=1 Tax=Podospora bellae-mahoneyi TaxID=2093777 RepID=A0ABR0FGE6_9PEZI|nr:Type I Iterative PKS [Podospora bellae-mahoneyi]
MQRSSCCRIMADQQPMPIAIVGMSCRLPGDVSTPGEFYRMLCRKRSGWSKVPKDRFTAEAYHHPNPDKKGCFNSQGGYFIKDDISMFDAGFFDITKKEAESMDPAQRLLLETAYEAFENGGFPKEHISGKRVGVFIGANYTEHRVGNLRDLDHIPNFDATGNQGAFLAGRLAYYFNLRGPAFTVDTACSSSLHALHLAVQSIRAGESESAIVGASHLITHPDIWVSMAKLRLFSDVGKTYAFDDRAKSGYARGEGAGCLILKPLAQAQADNDHIFSVITHSGISHNGRTVGIVAPSPEEQERLLRDVFAEAKIDPKDVGFFEAHGTGTKKGDPIEATAIYRAVGRHFTTDQPLYIGSAKPNVGHLEGVSGIVSVIKSVLMLYYGFILPNTEFETLNPAIPLDKWNMRVATDQKPWPSKRKYACVNNFGFSGSNSMCVLSAAPITREIELGKDAGYTPQRLFVLSANDETALRKSMKELGIWLEQHAELYQTTMPRNLAYTLCQRRSHLPWRVAVVAGMCSAVAGSLNSHEMVPARASSETPKLAFVFTGQGAQWHAMGRELITTHPVFKGAIMRADKTLRDIGADFSIYEELTRDKKSTKVGMAHISQPICSAVQLALIDLLESFGIRPTAVTGHSSGEIGAAYAAGALDFESAMAAAYYRGQVIIELKKTHTQLKGSMMAVGSGADELAPMLKALNQEGGPQAVVACENSPSSTTLSGDEEAIDRVGKMFQDKGVFNRKLFVDVAYHSPHMKLIAESYLAKISHIQVPDNVSSSNVEFYSSLRGRRIDLHELGPEYWVDNLTQAVRFSTSLQRLCNEHKPDILLEVGPHAALKGPIMQILKKVGAAATKISYIPTLVRDQDATTTCLEAAGQLFVRGYPLDFFNINHKRQENEHPDLVPMLYTYPWSKQKYWYESRLSRQHRIKPFARNDLIGIMADWSSELEPTWRNVVRTEDLPWLKEYEVQGRHVYPASAFVSMVVEAAAQQASLTGADVEKYDLRNLKIKEHLFVEDGKEFEVLLNFRALEGEKGHEFRITSYEDSRGWLEHCTGTVVMDAASRRRAAPRDASVPSARTEAMKKLISEADSSSACSSAGSSPPSSATSDAGHGSHTPATPTQDCSDQVCNTSRKLNALAGGGAEIYESLSALGMGFPKSFKSVVDVCINRTKIVANCCTRDTAADMPVDFETPFQIHPSVLDAMLQVPLLNLKSTEDGIPTAHLPVAIRHVTVRTPWKKRVNDTFCIHCNLEPKTATFMVEVFSGASSGAAAISMSGLVMKAVRTGQKDTKAPRELCFQYNWQPFAQAKCKGHSSDEKTKKRSDSDIVIVTEEDNDPLVSALCHAIEASTGLSPRVSSMDNLSDFGSKFLVLSDLEGPVLPNLLASRLEQIKSLLTISPGLIWITRGATRFPTNPEANMALGLIRTARSERSAVASSLDLDPKSKLSTDEQASLIFEALRESVLSEEEGEKEMEFAEEQGQLVVPRIKVDEKLNLDVHRSLGPSASYLQNFHQPGRQLRLAPHSSESFDDMYFEDCPETALGEDEIEIAVVASALSKDDADKAETHDAESKIVRSCSGTITRLGTGVRNFAQGTRVCALALGPFGTHARARTSSAVAIPAGLSMENAAIIPAAYAAAHYALVDLAKLHPSERILIQLAGPAGLAAVEVARHLGASAYVLVQNDDEAATAKRAGVSRERVLNAHSIHLRRQLEEATMGEGMDVVLTLSGNETNVAWECLSDFGRFVEIRTSATHANTRPGLGDNATFTSLNMASVAAARPKAMERTLKAVVDNIASGVIKAPSDATILPVSELSRGMEMVHNRAAHPVVVVAGPKEQVKAMHQISNTIFRRDGTHVIVGGTGGLGRSMAKFMIQHGARSIVLLSRSGIGKEMVDQLQKEANCPDARVVVKKCDASDEQQVQQLVAECSKSLPPICGVIHAAMVLRDVLLEGMTHEDYTQVIRPKVAGTWNIHNVLQSQSISLDYFVVLSSASGILGSRGQGAYAAANTFLDAFVQHRQLNGLPGTSLDLTAVTGAGYLAENAERSEDIIRNFGHETVSEEEVLALLSAAVRGECPAQCLTGLKLHLGADGGWPYYASDPRFTELKAECLAAAEREGLMPKQTISPGNAFRAANSDEEAANIAGQGILQKLSEVLTVDIQDLDVARNITSYGLDSLTAIELRNWIAKEFRANLQILELLSSGTINDLAALTVQKTRMA